MVGELRKPALLSPTAAWNGSYDLMVRLQSTPPRRLRSSPRLSRLPRIAAARPTEQVGGVSAKMVPVNEDLPVAPAIDQIDEDDRVAAIARLHDLFSTGVLSLQRFSDLLEKVLAAPGHADLETAMLALPPLVRVTPASRRLTKPLVLRAADGSLRLGAGWQLAADTTIRTGFGSALVDLTVASWDSCQINLHLETWGSIDVLVPQGVAVQMVGGSSGHLRLGSMCAPSIGGPVLRISTSGPTGVIRIHHPKKHHDGFFTRSKRRRPGDRSSPRG